MSDVSNILSRIKGSIDNTVSGKSSSWDNEADYLSKLAPNIIEWVTGLEYWNVPSTFEHSRQYQLLRDLFNLRCKICNSSKPEHIDCWGKSRMYLESEILLVWSEKYHDFVCPKCGTTLKEFHNDGLIDLYDELIIIAGMRSGKSYFGGNVGGYLEHACTAFGIRGKGYLQTLLKQEKSEEFQITYSASTEEQAEQTIYAKYRNMRKDSPWISRYMKWIKKRENEQVSRENRWKYTVSKEEIVDGYVNIRYNVVASDSGGVAGRTRIMAFIDEWARLANTDGTRSATELYRVLNQSLKTVRSATSMNDDIPWFFGMMSNVTSPIADDDPAMQTYYKARDGVLKDTFYWKGATWEFNPFQPRKNFDTDYAKDPIGAERDFGANPPTAASPFVQNPTRFWKSIDFDAKPIATFEYEFLTDPTEKKYIGASLIDCKMDVINQHFLMCDAGVTFDSFTVACAHPEWININSYAEESSEESNEEPNDNSKYNYPSGRVEYQSPYETIDVRQLNNINRKTHGDQYMYEVGKNIIKGINQSATTPTSGSSYEHRGEVMVTVVDFCLRIVPTIERDIWFDSIVKIVDVLRQKVNITEIGFDHWNSESSIQQIRSMGIMANKFNLKMEHFSSFVEMSYNNRVRMLPPHIDDKVNLTPTGTLEIGTIQEEMHGESIAIVEMLKLNRTPDLKKIFNPNKGKKRGRDSDDMARSLMGVHYLVQNSEYDDTATTKKKREIGKRIATINNPMFGNVYPGGRPY